MYNQYLETCIARYVGLFYNCDYTINQALVLRDSLSRGQLLSKTHLVDMLNTNKHFLQPNCTPLFIGHWHGLLPLMCRTAGLFSSARGIEVDPAWVDFSNKLNSEWDWQSSVGDAESYNLSNHKFVINTSCEHMSDCWLESTAPGTLVAAQSTNYYHHTHVNISVSLDNFVDKFKNYSIIHTDCTTYDVYDRYTILAFRKF